MDGLAGSVRQVTQQIRQAIARAQTSGKRVRVNRVDRQNIAAAAKIGGTGTHAVSRKQITRIRQRGGQTVAETVETAEHLDPPG